MMTTTSKKAKGKKRKSGIGEADDASARLIEVATGLFAEKGYEGTSVRDLAAAAGVNVAAVNYHFGSKEALYYECLRSCLAPAGVMRLRMQEYLEAAQRAKTIKAVEMALRLCIKTFLEELMHPDSKPSQLIMREQSTGSPQFEQVVREFFLPIGTIFQQLICMLAPGLSQQRMFMVISGIIGQCLHTYKARATFRVIGGIDSHSPEYIEQVSEHIAHFVVLGLRGLARERTE